MRRSGRAPSARQRPGGPGQRAARADRTGPRPEVERLGEAALVGHRATTSGRPSGRRPSGVRRAPPRDQQDGPAGGSAASHAHRPRPRRRPRVGAHDQQRRRSHRATASADQGRRARGRSTTTVSWPRRAARQRLADRGGVERATRARPAAPGEHAPARRAGAAPRAATERSAVRAAGRARPSARPGASSRPSSRSTPGPSGSSVDDERRARAAPRPGRARTPKRRGPGAAGAADDADHGTPAPAGAASPRSVSSSTSQLGAAGSSTTSLGPDEPARRGTPRRPGAQRDDVHPRPRRGGAGGELASEVGADQHHRRGRPRRAAPRGVVEATSASTPAAAPSRSELVAQRRVGGDEQQRRGRGGRAAPSVRRGRERPRTRRTGLRTERHPRRLGTASRRRLWTPVAAESPTDWRHGLPRLASRPTAAFFDLDKTIIAKSSTLAFSKPFQAGGLISRARGAALAPTPSSSTSSAAPTTTRWRRCGRSCPQLCAGWDVATVREIVAETLHDVVDPLVYDEAVSPHRGAPRSPAATS